MACSRSPQIHGATHIRVSISKFCTNVNLSIGMRHLNRVYTQSFDRRYKRVGKSVSMQAGGLPERGPELGLPRENAHPAILDGFFRK